MEIAQRLRAAGDRGCRAGDRRGGRACADGRAAIGDVGCLSFFPTKNLGAFGDAGMCVDQRCRAGRAHGDPARARRQAEVLSLLIGGNFRIDELQAAVLNVKLKHLDDWTAGRQRNAASTTPRSRAPTLGERRADAVAPRRDVATSTTSTSSASATAICCAQHLTAAGVGTEIYYPVPLHLQKCFAYLGHKERGFPAIRARRRGNARAADLSGATETQLQYVVDTIAAFYRRAELARCARSRRGAQPMTPGPRTAAWTDLALPRRAPERRAHRASCLRAIPGASSASRARQSAC